MLNLPLGPLVMDLQAHSISDEERSLLMHPFVGGVILFTRNFESLEQLTVLIAELKSLRSPSLLISVDHEGGRVQRFREEFTVLPPLAAIGHLFDHNKQAAIEAAKAHAWLMASELLAVGVDFSFAPVLDVDVGLSSVIGDRSFHHDKRVVSDLGKAYLLGMRDAGMASVGKHFPGHGQVKGDTHLEKPVDCRSLDEILEDDAQPFEHCINAGLDAVMPAHVVYDQVDDCPAGYSNYWLKSVLRERFNFKGMIFSDDLSMSAAESDDEEPLSYSMRAEQAINAGCDMVLLCNKIDGLKELLEGEDSSFIDGYLASEANKESMDKRNKMMGKQKMDLKSLRKESAWIHAEQLCAALISK